MALTYNAVIIIMGGIKSLGFVTKPIINPVFYAAEFIIGRISVHHTDIMPVHQ